MRWVGTGPIYLGLQQKCFSVCPSMVQLQSYFILNSIFIVILLCIIVLWKIKNLNLNMNCYTFKVVEEMVLKNVFFYAISSSISNKFSSRVCQHWVQVKRHIGSSYDIFSLNFTQVVPNEFFGKYICVFSQI